MTLEELYTEAGGDYAEAIGRLRSPALVARFVCKFPSDEASRDLPARWAAGDERATFDAAHTAKGVCGNLAFTPLAEFATAITEALRPGNEELRAATDVDALVERYQVAYERTVAAIEAFAAEA